LPDAFLSEPADASRRVNEAGIENGKTTAIAPAVSA